MVLFARTQICSKPSRFQGQGQKGFCQTNYLLTVFDGFKQKHTTCYKFRLILTSQKHLFIYFFFFLCRTPCSSVYPMYLNATHLNTFVIFLYTSKQKRKILTNNVFVKLSFSLLFFPKSNW